MLGRVTPVQEQIAQAFLVAIDGLRPVRVPVDEHGLLSSHRHGQCQVEGHRGLPLRRGRSGHKDGLHAGPHPGRLQVGAQRPEGVGDHCVGLVTDVGRCVRTGRDLTDLAQYRPTQKLLDLGRMVDPSVEVLDQVRAPTGHASAQGEGQKNIQHAIRPA